MEPLFHLIWINAMPIQVVRVFCVPTVWLSHNFARHPFKRQRFDGETEMTIKPLDRIEGAK